MSFLRRHIPILCFIAALAPAAFIWSWSGQIGVLGNDGPTYLMMAQHYQPGVATDLAYTTAAVNSKYPPVYPLALAAFAASEMHRAHAMTTVFLLLALGACYAWLIGERLSRTESAVLVCLFASLPVTWLTGLLIQSEFLFLLLSVVALTLMSGYQRRPRREVLLAAAIVVALASLTRTIGVTLYLPLLATAWRAPRRDCMLVLAVALAPLVGWHLLHRSSLGYSDELQGAYGKGVWDSLLNQIAGELPALRKGYGDNFLINESLRPLADLLGVIALLSAAWRIRCAAPDGLYILATVAVLVVWPYPEEARRFIWVLLPILMGQTVLAVSALVRHGKHRQMKLWGVKGVLACGVLIMTVPALMHLLQRYRAGAGSPIPDAAHNALWYVDNPADAQRWVGMQTVIIATLRSAGTIVPATGCILATRPDIVSFFGHRFSTYPPAPSIADADFPAKLRAVGCQYLFAIAPTDPHRRLAPLYPLSRIPGQFAVRMACAAPDDEYRNADPVCLLTELK